MVVNCVTSVLLVVVVAECLSTLVQKELELAYEDSEMAEAMEVPEVTCCGLLSWDPKLPENWESGESRYPLKRC